MNVEELLKSKAGQDPANRKRILAAARRVGALSHREREQAQVSALVSPKIPEPSRQGGLGVVITIQSFRRRLLDEDNLIAGAKALRDAIAASLGVDDADKRIKWEYRQQQTDGAEGTLVLLSQVRKP